MSRDFTSVSTRFSLIGSLSLACICLLAAPMSASAATILYRYDHHLFSIASEAKWKTQSDTWTFEGKPIEPDPAWLVDGDDIPPLPKGVARQTGTKWDTGAIRESLRLHIAAELDRAPGKATISMDSKQKVTFDGVGLPGREVDIESLTALTRAALERGITDVLIPVVETPPDLTIDSALQNMGIREVVTVGESAFAGSPQNRQHNIRVGLSKFNGHIIPKDTVFSFDTVLGTVDGSTGYLKELVIKGDRTIPDYGGGLCQVSTTAYRGVWEYGFPILARRNHSYAVSYYGPQGTDATVYPPFPDMQFKNDSPGALLMQTYMENDHAYFIYYGTHDTRITDVWGPVITDPKTPPPDRTIYSTSLPPGEKRKVGERHPGLTATWYRTVQAGTGTLVEPVTSVYEARPLFYEVGIPSSITLPGTEPIAPGDVPVDDSAQPVEGVF